MPRFSHILNFSPIFSLFAIALCNSASFAQTSAAPAPIETLRNAVEHQLNQFAASLAKPNPTPEIRQFANAARNLLALDQNPALAQNYIQQIFDHQDMDPASPAFGTVMWQLGHPEIKDPNSIEFTIYPLCCVFIRYADKLTPEFKQAAIPHFKAAVEGMHHHKVGLSYTNIYLMKMSNLHLLGQILGDTALADEGAKGLRDWFAFTRTNGITEFDSPTYACVQLAVLLQLQRLTTDPQLKKEAKAALDYFWTDLAANTFLGKAGGAQLAGPYSRTYDFPAGAGNFDNFLFFEKLRTTLPQPAGSADPLMNGLDDGYEPDAGILALPQLSERLIHQRFGEKSGQDRTCYLTQNFAIGSTSAYYLPHDRQLSISLASPTPLADISVECDQFDDPYGDHEVLDKTGHNKPTHLKNASATVQDKDTILALWNLAPAKMNPQLAAAPSTTLATNIIFPANADELLLDGKPITLKPGDEIPVPLNAWLIVRHGKAAAAMRIFTADPAGFSAPASGSVGCVIKYDGERFHAARLVAYHLQSKTPTAVADKSLRVGVILMAHDCPTSADALAWEAELEKATISEETDVSKVSDEGQWTTSFRAAHTTLSATMDLKTFLPTHRLINGKEFEPATFTLNGEDKSVLLPH